MGYTHYWTHQEKLDPQSVGRAVIDMAKVVEAKADLLGDGLGEGKPEIAEGMICFNGVGDNAYETFSFPGGWSNDGGGDITSYQVFATPGDIVVTTGGDADSLIISGLEGGVGYVFTVTAVNAGGARTWVPTSAMRSAV